MSAETAILVSLEAIANTAQANASSTNPALNFVFAQHLFSRLAQEELNLRSVDVWANIANDMFGFVQSRTDQQAKVRVFNPVLATNGFENNHTIIQIVNNDMPFLVDSVSMVLSNAGCHAHTLMHPVMPITRDAKHQLLAIDAGNKESFMYLEIDRQSNDAEIDRLCKNIESALSDVRESVADWQNMRDKMIAIAAVMQSRPMPSTELQRNEAYEFLQWASDNHFTFLGYREYQVTDIQGQRMLTAIPGSGLGLMRGKDDVVKPRPVQGLAAANLPPGATMSPLVLTKTNARSTVHRPGYMDYIGVLVFDENGRAIREERFLGLYTSSAYNRRPWDIPIVRQRHEAVMQASGFTDDSHSGKALRHILETLPRDELFHANAEELTQTSMGILSLQERIRPKLFLRREPFGRFYSCLVYIPRDRFSTSVRERIEALFLQELKGERLDTTIQIGESPLAQLHLTVRSKSGEKVVANVALLEAELLRIVRNFQDELRDQLVSDCGEENGLKQVARFAKALPAAYCESVSPEMAAKDIQQLIGLSATGKAQALNLYRNPDDQGLRFKLMRVDKEIALSDALPMLENLGLRINSEHPYDIRLDDARYVIQDFEVEPRSGEVDVETTGDRFQNAFAAVWSGQAESDGFNRLVLTAGLNWRDVAMLRSYCKYQLQTGVPFSQTYMEETLFRYPLIARLLVELFAARFEPSRDQPVDATVCDALHTALVALVPKAEREKWATLLEEVAADRGLDREAQFDACDDALAILLEKVSSLDEDRILRSFITVIKATLRTSFYQVKDGTHRDYMSFKFDVSKLPDLPKPRPYREIFVYSPWVEGVHLRFGPVARGGLRWSDRREDFRTEVLGLVKAQMVKNTVIVPVGSKGGFFVKRSPVGGDRDAVLAEGIACYKRFINGLLDITDNIVNGVIVAPKDVVRHDQDDPYLVVAADKGTATFSDIANGISAEHSFWLGDAFASGGSVGYDHKGMGITAKGGWESVKRHFRAMGRDSQTQDFTCVGIGDMSGDVFGNGMLLSQHIRLLAAFDHRHIFLDPNPDSAVSFKERDRMFSLPRSSWEDYDKSLISKGGGIYPRSSKTILLTSEVKAALAIDADVDAMAPNELMNLILKAPVDLLWNGGIGTYVKAASETHADCGDRANNGLRVNGNELRCKMIGEGGNLGMTQRGRIEAAHAGVLLNTDFIDNSAGVDTSDHEVNIKILLGAIVQRGDLSLPERNTLLASMTDEVGDLVLMDNYRQNQAISMMEAMSAERLGSFGHFIRTLESQGLLDRAIEFLPTDTELSERKSRRQGLTRPELSVLLSYDKIVIFNQLLDSDVPEDPYLSKELQRYFPKPLQEKYSADMENHRLRREIIATMVTNSMVNRMGSTFLLRMQEDTGETPSQIAKSYTISREILNARTWWNAIDGLDLKAAESVQIRALSDIWHLQRNMTRWLLNKTGENLNIAAQVERYAEQMLAFKSALPEILPQESKAEFEAKRAKWIEEGVPAEVANDFAKLPYLSYALDIIEVAIEHKSDVAKVGKVYFALSDALHTKWLMDNVETLPVEGRWHAQARGVLRDELQAQQRALVGIVLSQNDAKKSAEVLVAEWLARDDASLKYTLGMFADMRNLRSMDFATLSVAARRLAQIATASSRTL
jgi:glutamate dehydrogenase